mgnify:CR=1 FL=1
MPSRFATEYRSEVSTCLSALLALPAVPALPGQAEPTSFQSYGRFASKWLHLDTFLSGFKLPRNFVQWRTVWYATEQVRLRQARQEVRLAHFCLCQTDVLGFGSNLSHTLSLDTCRSKCSRSRKTIVFVLLENTRRSEYLFYRTKRWRPPVTSPPPFSHRV